MMIYLAINEIEEILTNLKADMPDSLKEHKENIDKAIAELDNVKYIIN